MKRNPFKWNGTFLGDITDQNIIERYNGTNFKYWKIHINDHVTTCMVKGARDCTFCIVDEIKPLFKLIKLGTHYVKYKSRFIILMSIRVTMDFKNIVEEVTLNNIRSNDIITEDLKMKILFIFVFRDIFRFNKNTESNIIIRYPNDNNLVCYPVSVGESSIKLEKMMIPTSPSTISGVTFKKWFKDIKQDNNQILSDMLMIIHEDNLILGLLHLKEKIRKVCERVCPGTYTHIADVVVNSVSQRLISMFISKREESIKEEKENISSSDDESVPESAKDSDSEEIDINI